MSKLLQILIPLAIFISLDLIIRSMAMKGKFKAVRIFESLFFIGFIFYLFFLFNRIGYLSTVISIIPITFVFREILANLVSTIILFLFPMYKQGDVINVGSISGIYQRLGFLRTGISAADGSVIKTPNSQLLNGLIVINE